MATASEISNEINEIETKTDACHPDQNHNLQEAMAHLTAAKAELADAAGEIGRAEAAILKVLEDKECPREFQIEILYDGVKKKFEVALEETIKTLLEKAIKAFGVTTNPHTLSLFKDGQELADTLTVKEAGIKPCDELLLLRPSKVKGG